MQNNPLIQLNSKQTHVADTKHKSPELNIFSGNDQVGFAQFSWESSARFLTQILIVEIEKQSRYDNCSFKNYILILGIFYTNELLINKSYLDIFQYL